MVEFHFSEEETFLFPTRIVTDRLRLESYITTDVSLGELYDIQGSEVFEEVIEKMPGDKHGSPKDTSEEIKLQKEAFEAGMGASYILFERESDELIGRSGFGVNWGINEVQLYIWLLPEYQGNGYSAERGEAFLELLFDRVDLETVRAGAILENKPSQKAIEKYIVDNGGVEEGVFRNYKLINGELKDVRYYSITQDEWSD